jgi:hypothetical protein
LKIKISNDITLLGQIIVVIVYTFFAKGMFPYSKVSAEMMDHFKVCLRKKEKKVLFSFGCLLFVQNVQSRSRLKGKKRGKG